MNTLKNASNSLNNSIDSIRVDHIKSNRISGNSSENVVLQSRQLHLVNNHSNSNEKLDKDKEKIKKIEKENTNEITNTNSKDKEKIKSNLKQKDEKNKSPIKKKSKVIIKESSFKKVLKRESSGFGENFRKTMDRIKTEPPVEIDIISKRPSEYKDDSEDRKLNRIESIGDEIEKQSKLAAKINRSNFSQSPRTKRLSPMKDINEIKEIIDRSKDKEKKKEKKVKLDLSVRKSNTRISDTHEKKEAREKKEANEKKVAKLKSNRKVIKDTKENLKNKEYKENKLNIPKDSKTTNEARSSKEVDIGNKRKETIRKIVRPSKNSTTLMLELDEKTNSMLNKSKNSKQSNSDSSSSSDDEIDVDFCSSDKKLVNPEASTHKHLSDKIKNNRKITKDNKDSFIIGVTPPPSKTPNAKSNEISEFKLEKSDKKEDNKKLRVYHKPSLIAVDEEHSNPSNNVSATFKFVSFSPASTKSLFDSSNTNLKVGSTTNLKNLKEVNELKELRVRKLYLLYYIIYQIISLKHFHNI